MTKMVKGGGEDGADDDDNDGDLEGEKMFHYKRGINRATVK